MNSTKLRVFVVFALGYFVSYLYRGVNIGFAPMLMRDLGLSTTDLGSLTSLYVLGFAGAQIPAGVLLDHFGARRVTACVMLLAVVGILVYGGSHSLAALMVGRLLIGVGVSVCLAGAFKANAQHFPVSQLTLVNGLVMAVGGLGGVAVGTPLSWILSLTDWRSVCVALAAITAAVAMAIGLFAPKTPEPRGHATMLDQLKGTAHILRSRAFWKAATFSALTQSVFYAMQSLWASAYLRDVLPNTADVGTRAASLISVMGLAFIAGMIGFGALARVLERRGLSVYLFSGLTMVLFVTVQIAIATQIAIPQVLLWSAYGALGGTGIMTYSVLAAYFPARLLGRVNTTFTLVIFLLIFVMQSAIGSALGHWSSADGHYPAAAHQAVWLGLIVVQIIGAIWYFMPTRESRSPRVPASHSAF